MIVLIFKIMEEKDIMDIGDLGAEAEREKEQEQIPDESPEKKKYIDENVISKGIYLEDLSRSITIRTGLTINEINLDLLKKEVEFFKNEQKKESLKLEKELKSASKMEKNDILKKLFSNERFQIKTKSQLNNKLVEMEAENKKINPKICHSHQEKTGGGLLGKKITYYFNIKCPELNTEVGRTLEDFEFFQKILIERYPFRYIPPIFPKSAEKEYSHELFKRYLNRFLEYISQRKILRTSPITLEFLELDSNSFFTYKKNLTANKYVCKFNMENFINMKGNLDLEFTQDKLNECEKIYKKIEATRSIYKNLDVAMGKIINDLNNLERHMKQASNAFSALFNYNKESKQSPLLVSSFEKLKDIFSQWSTSYNKQKIFLNNNFRETFHYLDLQIKALGELEKQHSKIKNDYEKYGLELYAKKEKLFNGKKYNLWELSDENNKNIEFLKQNKESAFNAMLPGMTNLVLAQKVQMACSTIIVNKEYEKFMKRQGNDLKKYLLSLKENNQDLVSDSYALSSLFNIELKA